MPMSESKSPSPSGSAASPLNRELELAKNLARRAGAVILEHYYASDGIAVSYKDVAQSDPVTKADKDANNLIVAGLIKEFPGDAILAEESADTRERFNHTRLWCVDPLDGTREYIDRNGMFVVMIGLAIDGRARLGVVYHPTEDTLYWGADGQAGFQKGDAAAAPLRVQSNNTLRMMVSRSHRSPRLARVAEDLGVAEQLPVGSVGLKVAELASGRAQVYVSLTDRTQEWDACAPEAILAAAGGTMTDWNGEPLLYNKDVPNTPRGMVASCGDRHQRVLAAVQKVIGEDVG